MNTLNKECRVVMLATNNATEISLHHDNKLFQSKRSIGNLGQHLYIISDDEIKEGDWYIVSDFSKLEDIRQAIKYLTPEERRHNGFKKIIATTDKLITSVPIFNSWKEIHIPQIPQEFIEKYIESYNTGSPIEKVLVEYEDLSQKEGNIPMSWDDVPKVNPDNTISITSVKDTFTREEVEILCHEAFSQGEYGEGCTAMYMTFEEWKKQNLK